MIVNTHLTCSVVVVVVCNTCKPLFPCLALYSKALASIIATPNDPYHAYLASGMLGRCRCRAKRV